MAEPQSGPFGCARRLPGSPGHKHTVPTLITYAVGGRVRSWSTRHVHVRQVICITIILFHGQHLTGLQGAVTMARKPQVSVPAPRRDPDEKLTLAEVCKELRIERSTFYDWRAKRRGPRCITLPNGSLRVRRRDLDRWLSTREDAA